MLLRDLLGGLLRCRVQAEGLLLQRLRLRRAQDAVRVQHGCYSRLFKLRRLVGWHRPCLPCWARCALAAWPGLRRLLRPSQDLQELLVGSMLVGSVDLWVVQHSRRCGLHGCLPHHAGAQRHACGGCSGRGWSRLGAHATCAGTTWTAEAAQHLWLQAACAAWQGQARLRVSPGQ